jgi:hypothetical protein
MDDLTHFSVHAMKRMRQRGLTPDMVTHAMAYGRLFHRQGFEFYCVASKDLPDRMGPTLSDRLRNLVVVCCDGVVVTTYRNGDCFRNVRKKGKRLARY